MGGGEMMGGMGGGGGGGGAGGGQGLEQLLAMLGGGGGAGGQKGGGQGGGTSDHNAGKNTWEKLDAFGNIADGSKDLRPAEHSEFNSQAPAPLQAPPAAPVAPQRQPQPLEAMIGQTKEQPQQFGYNEAQGQALDDYAAEELARRQRSMDIA